MATVDTQSTEAVAQQKCWPCAQEFELSAGRLHGRKFYCGVCSNAHRTMRRNLDGMPEELSTFSAEEQTSFFRSLHVQKSAGPGGLTWQTIRAQLIHCTVEKHTSSTKETLTGEWLPMSVWVSRGWKEEVVKRQKQRESEDYGETVYQVAIKADTWEEVHARVTESMLRQERNASKKKNNKEAADLDVPVEAAGSTDQKKEKSMVAAAKRTARENEKIQNLAAKGLATWTKLLAQCEKILAKDNLETMEEGTQKAFQDLKATLQKNDKAARVALNDGETNKGKPLIEMKALAELPYQGPDIQALTKQAAVILKDVRDQLPKPAPKAAGKRKQVEEATIAAPERRRRRGKTNP